MKKKDYIVIGIGVLCIAITLIVGVTFAYWRLSKVQEDENIVSTSCFDVSFSGNEGITLNNAFPISDEQGLQQIPYTFTISNTCDTWTEYQINLETLKQASGVKVLPDEYIHADLQEGSTSVKNSKLDSSIVTTATLDNATTAYKLYTGTLGTGASKTYSLRIWLDKDVTAENEDSMEARYEGKITIDFTAIEEVPRVPFGNASTLMAAYYNKDSGTWDTTGYFWDYKKNITTLVFQDTLNPYDTEYVWDVSVEQDENVMAYLVENEDTATYTLYLQGDTGIYANENSGSLFGNFSKLTSIEGLEYFNTSRTTNMQDMFDSCSKLTNLDLSHFDTSQVTSMYGMFENCSSLVNIDVSSFNTSQVTTMFRMFKDCSKLSNLTLGIDFFNNENQINVAIMLINCPKLNTTITIKKTNLNNTSTMVGGSATAEGALITINYTEETSDLVDEIIESLTPYGSHIVKGQLIEE